MDEMKKEFIYAAINDAQELIRFTDTKTAIGISVIAAYVAAIFSMTENIVKYDHCLDTLFWILLILVLSLIVTCIVITARIIRPTSNPLDNIKNHSGVPNLKFFLAEMEYNGFSRFTFPFWNSSSSKLSESLETHLQNIDLADDKTIEKVLSIEMLKVNYIRNIKTERFNVLFTTILVTSVVFFAFYIHYSQQIVLIKSLFECSCKTSAH